VTGGITVLERQSDNALLKTHTIPTGSRTSPAYLTVSFSLFLDRPLDNLSVDTNGVVWAAAFPDAFAIVAHIADPSKLSPSSALSIAMNTGPGSFYGEKFKVTKVYTSMLRLEDTDNFYRFSKTMAPSRLERPMLCTM
jgi:hypothetical protein